MATHPKVAAPKPPAVEKDVPIPDWTRGAPRTSFYPFAKMVVGDSFFLPAEAAARKGKMNAVSGAARAFGRKNTGYKFSARSVAGGVRLWRVAEHEPEL